MSTSSQGGSLSPQSTVNGSPPGPENIKSLKHPCVISPASSINVPDPAGITEPVSENAITVDPPTDIINPFAPASPPNASSTHPL